MTAPSRRAVLGLGAGAALAGVAATPAAFAAPSVASGPKAPGYRTTVALLGTSGGPPPMDGRTGISSAVVVGDATYLVDLGHGTFNQLHRSGISPASIRSMLITHLHSDHLAEAYTLPWLRFGGVRPMRGPVDVYGPGSAGALPPSRSGPVELIHPERPTPGIEDFFASAMAGSAYDLNLRMLDEGWPDIRELLRVHDIVLPDIGASAPDNLFPDMDPFLVFEDDRVRVTATLVKHPPVFPAFGFRFDTEDGSVVFSGDTTVSENLMRLASGADVLVHEVINVDVLDGLVPPEIIAHLLESHTNVDDVGAVAESADVGTLVLNHLVPGDPAEVNDGQWRRCAQHGFSGKVVVGRDLMTVGVGKRRR